MRKLGYKEDRFEREQRLLRKDISTERMVLEEVFDKSTLMTVYKFLNRGVIDEIHGVVEAGKEARIYWGKDRSGKELAVKIFLTVAAEFKKGKLQYIEGDPRFKRVKRDTRSLVFAWAIKEFKNLHLAQRVKVKVPKPIAVEKNVLVMQFIGKNGLPAPRLKELPPKDPEYIYNKLLEYIGKLYCKAELVHGDISEYNVMVWRRKPVLFDMAQAVLVSHPLSKSFLLRDLKNLRRYFKKFGVQVLSVEDMYEKVVNYGKS